jgi:hypothetical protein
MDQVAELHREVFGVAPQGAPDLAARYRRYFSEVFLGEASGEDELRSLVHEEERGAITGFLGVVPRRLCMNGRRVGAALCTQFVVHPDSRPKLAAVKLLKAFLEGPQDLSIADEANAVTRKLWEALGGTTALVYSLHWTRPLRACRFALSRLAQRPALRPLANAAIPVAAAVDALAARLDQSPLRQSAPPRLSGESVTAADYLAHLPRFIRGSLLRPDPQDPALASALSRLGRSDAEGPLRTVLLRDDQGKPRGAYLYAPGAGGVGEVIQIAADSTALADVVQHLFHDAWRRGMLALCGRLEPRLVQTLSDQAALFHRRGPWTLIHARRPEIVPVFEQGGAFFSRLEGELCLRFDDGQAIGA